METFHKELVNSVNNGSNFAAADIAKLAQELEKAPKVVTTSITECEDLLETSRYSKNIIFGNFKENINYVWCVLLYSTSHTASGCIV